jgi:hypothetical protein
VRKKRKSITNEKSGLATTLGWPKYEMDGFRNEKNAITPLEQSSEQLSQALDFFALILVHLVHKLVAAVMPPAAIVIAKATLIPHAYARRTPSSSAPENTWRRFVAPVAVTRAESTLGAVLASLCTSWLTKPDCAAVIINVAPIDRATMHEGHRQLKDRRLQRTLTTSWDRVKENLHMLIAVTGAMSLGAAKACAMMIGIWRPMPYPKPAKI